jgi:hypothetical protein
MENQSGERLKDASATKGIITNVREIWRDIEKKNLPWLLRA